MDYDFSNIEKKWQEYYDKHQTFSATEYDKPKYYYLVEFPYPSGDGLHVGHTRGYTAIDVMARKKRMQGFNVLFPMGWDAFGEAAEGYAIKHKIHPKEAVQKNIASFKNQCQKLGYSFDWSREFSTTDEDYMKWTQWQFIKFFEHGMAYKAPAKVNWCPVCKITKSNEEAAGGVCDRCGSAVVEMQKEQWMLKMKDYAQDLLDGLKDTNYIDRIKTAQINWIGKTKGLDIKFKIKDKDEFVTVFTTRPDTIFGVTSIQIAPSHGLIEKYASVIPNYAEIENYIKETDEKEQEELKRKLEESKGADKQKRKQMRKDSFKKEKEKTGVLVKGLFAINPVNQKEVPIFVSNYVLSDKGTGAVMSVPAHDQRDYVFAKNYGTEIIQVIEGGDISKSAYTGDGKHINSGYLDGLNNEQAFEKVREELSKQGLCEVKTDYKLDDWVFSRQRFWGEPIPLVKCEKHGWVAVKDEDLPVTLPNVASYEPTDTGESPLAKITDWVNTTCPICGGPAKRETDTMPGWAGSSWYFLRFMDAHNDKEFASQKAMKYWGKVDFYDGGMEHAARHLLYARFWNHFLNDIGLVPNREPVDRRIAHGMVLGEGGVKMSKSLGNVVNPNMIVDKYGADALRIFMMFMGNYEDDVNWSEEGVRSCKKFIERVIKLGEKLGAEKDSQDLNILLHKTIKKVTSDIDATKFNTAISAMHILVNKMEQQSSISKQAYRTLLLLLHPYAPHITEELNSVYSLGEVLAYSAWPTYNESDTIDQNITISVQVNGKFKGTIDVLLNEDEESLKQKAVQDETISKYLVGKEIVRFIIIKNRAINIIAK